MRIERFIDNPRFKDISGWVIVRGDKRRQYYSYYGKGGHWVKDAGNAHLFRFEEDAKDVLEGM